MVQCFTSSCIGLLLHINPQSHLFSHTSILIHRYVLLFPNTQSMLFFEPEYVFPFLWTILTNLIDNWSHWRGLAVHWFADMDYDELLKSWFLLLPECFPEQAISESRVFFKDFSNCGVYVQRRWVRSWVVACCNCKKKSQIVQKQPKLGKVATSFQVTMGFIAPRGMMALEEEMVARSIRWVVDRYLQWRFMFDKIIGCRPSRIINSHWLVQWYDIYYIILYYMFVSWKRYRHWRGSNAKRLQRWVVSRVFRLVDSKLAWQHHGYA